ncbi:MAG TPA: glucosamine-6-phosphate deaminase [Parafilimonas sp.]|nr:glucosamine-6-phosphate deaminase [Parafilimonas sp.]
MKIEIYNTPHELGAAAAKHAASLLQQTIKTNGTANIILATGTSQFETLKHLVNEDVDWSKVTMFHLDEYIGLPITHPASFRKYLQERFISKVNLKNVYLINSEANPQQACEKLGELILHHPIDVALVGIGENGHLAFNDPPADFETEEPYIIVELDDACRQQQMNEGWFNSIDDVPQKAISMSIKQIMKSKNIICSVPDKRKAAAVKNCLENSVSNFCPASILQAHKNCIIYLDKVSASLLSH